MTHFSTSVAKTKVVSYFSLQCIISALETCCKFHSSASVLIAETNFQLLGKHTAKETMAANLLNGVFIRQHGAHACEVGLSKR